LYAKSGGKNASALAVSQRTVIMLENMMRSSTDPIHPVAFFAAVKDFESAGDLKWASYGSGGLRYFSTRNCSSGECFGLFQVDVKQERDWRGGEFCQSGGLNLWSTPGGPDFCASQFWWTVAEGGNKCTRITADGRANPCRQANYTWTLENVRRGVNAYVQQPQWGRNSWAEMYQNYESCYTNKNPFDRKAALKEAIAKFRNDVGLDGSDNVATMFDKSAFPSPIEGSPLFPKSDGSTLYGSVTPDFSSFFTSQN
jgi:hypothetical protein